MRPRRVRLGWGRENGRDVLTNPSFNEAEARAPRMALLRERGMAAFTGLQ